MSSFLHKLTDAITLDSKDRLSSSTSSSNFIINFPQSSRKIDYIHFRSITIPLIMDNIKTAHTFELDDVDQKANLPNGQYGISALMDTLTANITNYTFEFLDNKRVKITNTVPANFKFEPLTMGILLGFTAISYTGATSYTATRHPNLLPTNYITMHSDFIAQRQTHNNYHSDNRGSMIAKIPMGDLGQNYLWEPEEPLIKSIESTNTATIDFEFRDDNNVTIDIQDKNIIIDLDRITK